MRKEKSLWIHLAVIAVLFLALLVLCCCGTNFKESKTEECKVFFFYDDETAYSVSVIKGETVDEPEIPIREGYVFTGWFCEGEIFDFDTAILHETELIADWREETAAMNIQEVTEFATVGEYNYDFSTEADNDLLTVSSVDGGIIDGIVPDPEAEDGYALKAVTGYSNVLSGISICFPGVDVNKYSSIWIRIKTSNYVNVEINGEYRAYRTFQGGFMLVDVLKEYMQEDGFVLNSLEFGRKTCSNVEIFIDSIVFVEKGSFNYNYSGPSDLDIYATSGYAGEQGTAKIEGILADSGATDGYALAVKLGGTGRFETVFDSLPTDGYESIKIRIRAQYPVAIYLNEISGISKFASVKQDEYTIIDLKDSVSQGEILKTLIFCSEYNAENLVYIDSIEFIEKTVSE